MSSLCWIQVHGWDDDVRTIDELIELAMTEKIYVTCGPVSLWAKKILFSQSIESRIITTMTLESWNDYFNGHTLLEVYWDDRWILYDLDNNSKPMIDEHDVNAMEFCKAVVAKEDYNLFKLADDPSYSEGKNTDYKKWLLLEDTLSGESGVRRAYSRVFQAPCIVDTTNSIWYTYNEELYDRLVNESGEYTYVLYSENEFDEYFY